MPFHSNSESQHNKQRSVWMFLNKTITQQLLCCEFLLHTMPYHFKPLRITAQQTEMYVDLSRQDCNTTAKPLVHHTKSHTIPYTIVHTPKILYHNSSNIPCHTIPYTIVHTPKILYHNSSNIPYHIILYQIIYHAKTFYLVSKMLLLAYSTWIIWFSFWSWCEDKKNCNIVKFLTTVHHLKHC